MASGMLKGLFESFDAIEHGLDAQAVQITRDNDNILIDMNTEQLFAGLNSKGQSLDSIGGGYSPVTIQIKKSKGQPTDRVTLKDTGDFYEGFFLETKNGGWDISSSDDKTQGLINDWGADLFGNTEDDEREFNIEYIIPGLLQWVLANLKL